VDKRKETSVPKDACKQGSSPQYPTVPRRMLADKDQAPSTQQCCCKSRLLGEQLEIVEVSSAELICRMEDLSGCEIGTNFNHSLRSFDMSRFMSKDRSDDG
jgi:hypothetical protein